MIWNENKTIGAKVIAASYDTEYTLPPLYTMELVYPHIVHAHLLTHRVFSRNTASSRAIPSSTPIPLHNPEFRQNKAGMSPGDSFDDYTQCQAKIVWFTAYDKAYEAKQKLAKLKVHKQWANRLTEPYEMKKVIVSSTEWDNFFWLRDHEDAQDEIRELAQLIKQAYSSVEPQTLPECAWHIPYFKATNNGTYINTENGKEYSTWEAITISTSAVAQVSYRKLDFSMEKAMKLWDVFVGDGENSRLHGSVFEHIAIPMTIGEQRVRGEAMHKLRKEVAYKFDDPVKLDNYIRRLMFPNNFNGWNQLRDFI